MIPYTCSLLPFIMSIVITATDCQEPPGSHSSPESNWLLRHVAKVVLVSDLRQVALMHNKLNSFVGLPGGGIFSSETIRAGAIRECEEETGVTPAIVAKLGRFEDFRCRNRARYISHGFLATTAHYGEPVLTHKEAEIGLHTEWHSIDNAARLLTTQVALMDAISFYNTSFNVLRDHILFTKSIPLLDSL